MRSETLRDFGAERMTFRHDVLRDWAVANVLIEDIGKISLVPLDKPIPTTLARGVEMAARVMLEKSSDGSVWKQLLDGGSDASAHGSWRRTVLLAVTRSEHAAAAIHHADAYLVTDDARLLRELLRTVKAVDVMPASAYLPEGVAAPGGLMLPSGPSWGRLIVWSLGLRDRFPAAAIPDTVDILSWWLAIAGATSKVAPNVVGKLYTWLMATERDDREPPFNGVLTAMTLCAP